MTGAPQKEYIITEDQLRDLIYARYEKEGGTVAEDDQVHELVKGTLAEVRHGSTTSAEKVLEHMLDDLEFLPSSEDSKKVVWVALRDVRGLIDDKIAELRQQERERG